MFVPRRNWTRPRMGASSLDVFVIFIWLGNQG
jgi:hypothetical protein